LILKNKLIKNTLELSRSSKRLIAIAVDIAICLLTVWLAFYLRLGIWVSLFQDQLTTELLIKSKYAAIASIIIALPIFSAFGLYRAIFRYSGWPAMRTISIAMGVYSLFYALIFTTIGIPGVPRTIGLIQPLLLFFLVGLSRAFISFFLSDQYRRVTNIQDLKKAYIYGAGETGRMLARVLHNNQIVQILGFIDDNPSLEGGILDGIKIYGSSKFRILIEQNKITDIYIAIPSALRDKKNEIINQLEDLNIAIKTVPSISNLSEAKLTTNDILELEIEDVLGRNFVEPNLSLLKKNITGRDILVSGAGGSIGSELCRQIIALKPKTLVMLDHSEFALYKIEEELKNLIQPIAEDQPLLIGILASVQNQIKLQKIISKYQPHIIFHAAAYKHVPIVEKNPEEGLLNNTYGTYNIAKIAQDLKIKNFVLISTDKAVRPTNIMGASKRLAEMIIQALSHDTAMKNETIFSIVRFGNVLDSSGSVVPLFRKQIQCGGPITLTHTEVTRYFMLLPEAAQLVIQSSSMATGGEVFVLDMGKPVKIFDLAKKMIRFSGLRLRDELNPSGDIEINVTGLRHGEKLHEEIFIGNNPVVTQHPGILKASEHYISLKLITDILEDIRKLLINNDIDEVKKLLGKLTDGKFD